MNYDSLFIAWCKHPSMPLAEIDRLFFSCGLQEDPHLVWQCHLEVMKTLQRHEHLLNKTLGMPELTQPTVKQST